MYFSYILRLLIILFLAFLFNVVRPGKPGTPTTHENKPAFLVLQWHEGSNGNAPVTLFELEYRKGNFFICLFVWLCFVFHAR